MRRTIDWDALADELEDRHGYAHEAVEGILPKLRRIADLLEERNALLVAHYYQIPPIQLIADFRGDSLALAMKAREVGGAEVIESCTVHFMAETMKIVNPEKEVWLPSLEAGCSNAEGMTAGVVRRLREAFPDAGVMGYVNTFADVKAELDAVCTSANAARVLERLPERRVLFVPDQYMGENLARGSSKEVLVYRRIEGGHIVVLDAARGEEVRVELDGVERPAFDRGSCIVHEQFTPEQVERYRRQHRVEKVLAHLEVKPEVAAVADAVGSTSSMLKYVAESPARRFLYVTECHMGASLIHQFPDREFVTPCTLCPYMKKVTLDNVIESLERGQHRVAVPEEVAARARRAIERMVELGGS